MIVAPPVPKALTIPAVAPCPPPLFLLTGKTFGTEEIQLGVGELVRSLTYGAVAKIKNARNWPVSCRLPTVMVLGTIVSERRGSGAAVNATATVAVPDTTLPSALDNSAVDRKSVV